MLCSTAKSTSYRSSCKSCKQAQQPMRGMSGSSLPWLQRRGENRKQTMSRFFLTHIHTMFIKPAELCTQALAVCLQTVSSTGDAPENPAASDASTSGQTLLHDFPAHVRGLSLIACHVSNVQTRFCTLLVAGFLSHNSVPCNYSKMPWQICLQSTKTSASCFVHEELQGRLQLGNVLSELPKSMLQHTLQILCTNKFR